MATYTTTNAPLPWMEDYLKDFMVRAQDVANTDYKQGPGTYTGPNDLLQSGWQMTANRAMRGSPEMSAARGQLNNTIGGQFLGRQASANPYLAASNPYAQMNNPFLQQSIDNAQGDLARNYNLTNKPAWDKAMQSSGSFGNTGVSEYAQNDRNNLMQNMGRISTDMRMGAYNQQANLAENQVNRMYGAGQDYAGRQDSITGQERGYQQSAMGMAPAFANQDYTDINNLMNAGGQQQQFNQQYQNQQQQFFNDARNFPQQQLDAYGRALGVNAGGTSTQTAPDPSTFSQLAGGALVGANLWDWAMKPPK